MPRLINRNPSYRKHRATGQAVATFDGRDVYLGKFGTAASRLEYDRVMSEWLTAGRRLPPSTDLAVVELCDRFWEHAQSYYRHPDGSPTGEAISFKYAMGPLVRLYGPTPVADFKPLALQAVRAEMVRMGWCRNVVNRQTGRIKQIFKWGVANELVRADVYAALMAVVGLHAGRTAAKESKPVRPVSDAMVEATLPHLSPTIRAMVEVQRLTGCRPGEVCAMRMSDLDRTGEVWTYRPTIHKLAWRGRERVIFIGPKAQEILTPFLKLNPNAYLFSPAESEQQRRDAVHAARVTPMSCGNRPGSNRRRRPQHTPGDRYDTCAYALAIKRGCQRAFAMPDELLAGNTPDARLARKKWRAANTWNPNQLRHSSATRIRREFGLESAGAVLGHSKLETTQVYAERDRETARRVAAAIG